jgi:tetratricopeptide (TPR) repeat protein
MDVSAGSSATVNPNELQRVMNDALGLHQAGRLADAEPLYMQVLSVAPNHPDALHLLGVLFHQSGRSGQGLELINRSVQIAPTFASLNNLGDVLRTFGRHHDAIVCFDRAIQMQPDSPDAHSNMGLAMMEIGQVDQAERYMSRACQIAPNRPDLHLRLCMIRHTQGNPHGAVLAGQKAVELLPNSGEAWSNFSLALASAKKFDQAMDAANKALELSPNRAGVYNNLGFVHERAGRTAEAEAAYQKAIELDPNFATAHRNLAALYDGMDKVENSIQSLERSLSLAPRDQEGWTNLSGLRRRMRDYPAALAAAEQAVQINPSNPNAHGNLGLSLLALGEYDRGFAEYEWRWRCSNFTTAAREFSQPMWDGSDPTGRTIFVHAEQGFGDTLQFARYVPLLAERGAKVFFESALPLRTLMQKLKGVNKVIASGTRPPDFDLHIPLLSLPRIFRTTLQTVPADVPYISVDEARMQHWDQRLKDAGPGRRIGLVWAGNVKPDAGRTIPLEKFAPLTAIEGVTFISLQKRENPQGADAPPAGLKLIDVSEDLKDFAETAAAMMNLDLILTIDTAAAHLAGALGRPTWTLLPWAADWRWLNDRTDSPWYPTMRLFRQPTRGDWDAVIQEVAAELERRAQEA